MAETFKFELVSPEQLLISQEVEQVVAPGTEGYFAVLKGHAPILSTLRPGVLDIRVSANEERRVFVRGGFAEGGPEGLTVLAEQAIPLEELDSAALNQQIQDGEEDVADAKSDEARRVAQERLDHLRQLQQSL